LVIELHEQVERVADSGDRMFVCSSSSILDEEKVGCVKSHRDRKEVGDDGSEILGSGGVCETGKLCEEVLGFRAQVAGKSDEGLACDRVFCVFGFWA